MTSSKLVLTVGLTAIGCSVIFLATSIIPGTSSPAWFSPGSVSFEWAKGIPATIISLAAALAVGAIALRQYHVARAKLNLDLFEKRYEIFMMVWTELSDAVQGKKQPTTLASPLGNILPRSRFLFGDDIENYLSEVNAKLIDLATIQSEADANNGILPAESITPRRDLMIWLNGEASTGAKAKFGRYLDFGAWK